VFLGNDVLIASVSAVSVPGAFWLLGSGLSGLVMLGRIRNQGK
jgi:hypothetical protein